MMTYREFVDRATQRLDALYPREEARSAAVQLLSATLNIPSYRYMSDPSTAIADRNVLLLEAALDELSKGRPLQYVLGYTFFCGLRVKVREGVLIPRPETEEMVSVIVDECSSIELEDSQEFNVLDLCTGSGCIAYALADAFPEAQVYGCDLSDDALRIACRQKIGIRGGRPVFFKADIFDNPPAGLPKFDLMVSNPPYICEEEKSGMRPNVLDYEPAEALFVPDDDPLKFYKAIRRWTDMLLVEGGLCFMEINERFGPEVSAIFEGSEVLKDISGKDRFVRWRK